MKDKMFYRHAKQNYARFDSDGKCTSLTDGKLDRITVGIYPDGGNQGTTGEFSISWIKLGGESTPYLELFEDSWHLLSEMPELFEALSKKANSNPTPDEIEAMLLAIGYNNRIKR